MANAQVSAPTYARYDLHSLGWKAFQDLCLTVLSTQLGQAVQRYLLGEPAVGKTAIAATLTLASGDAWKCRAMRLERPSDLRQHWNPEDPKQLFWLDDAFGSMQYEATRS